jgi:hypothetical protein
MRLIHRHLALTLILYLGPLAFAAQQAEDVNDRALAALQQKAEAGDVTAAIHAGHEVLQRRRL